MATETDTELSPQAAYSRRVSEARADIGELLNVVDIDRRMSCTGRGTLPLFLETYLSDIFYDDWSPIHLQIMEAIEDVMLHGGRKAIAMPRGEGKTSICQGACLWATLTGYRSFPVMIGANQGEARETIGDFKVSLETNPILAEDFPEVCFPVRCLEGKSQRCASQTQDGTRTRMTWRSDKLVFPTISEESLQKANVPLDSNGCGAIVRCAGIKSASSGFSVTMPDGRKMRPDIILIDDPQTTSSAQSPADVKARLSNIRRMMESGGHDTSLSAVMPCTVICPDDMADRILDMERHPLWQGHRTGRVLSFPNNEDLWDKYADILRESMARPDTRIRERMKPATDFYEGHREAMEKGAEVSWEPAFEADKGEVSALQHAMNIKILEPELFWAELQNEPEEDDEAEGQWQGATKEDVMRSVNNRPRYEVPEKCETLTAYVDIHDKLLYYVVCAWREDFTGFVVDYDTWPDQGRRYFTMDNAKRTMQDNCEATTKEGIIYQSLQGCSTDILSHDWVRADGDPMHIETLACDQRYKTDAVMRACKEHPHSDRLQPAFGQSITAKNTPISQYKRGGQNRGDRIGNNWILKRRMPDNPMRSLMIDVNSWKTYIHERVKLPAGEPGGITVFGSNPQRHRLFAEHVTAEYGVQTEGHGRRLVEWSHRPGRPDNHWFDCLVGCAAAASFSGIGEQKRREKRERKSLAELAGASRE